MWTYKDLNDKSDRALRGQFRAFQLLKQSPLFHQNEYLALNVLAYLTISCVKTFIRRSCKYYNDKMKDIDILFRYH